MPVMAKKRKPKDKRPIKPLRPTPKPPKPPCEGVESNKLFQIAQAIWKASHKQERIIQDYRRKESLGWALAAARHEGELTAQHGGSLVDCLHSVIKVLQAQVHFLSQGDGA